MKQLIQGLQNSGSRIIEVPQPPVQPGRVLVAVSTSLVSAGTERMVIDFAEKGMLQKARARPDLVRQVAEKARRDGILTTLESVRTRLDQPLALGYSCAGTVVDVEEGGTKIQIGDQVACAGGGYAIHAEVVSIPKNLAVKLPDGVDREAAAFGTLGAIALQGIRLAEVKLGEIVAVIGLGLVGQLTVQMLKASGCVVVGMDIRAERVQLARQLGADAAATDADGLLSAVAERSLGHGADAVIITADTKENQPVELAGQVARDKGIVVAVGAVSMDIPRKAYYEKELDFRISRSYGPGRYDPEYEEKGHDYPYAYVRWTEQRNLQAFLQLLAEKKVLVGPLISHRFPIEEAPRAYELITGKTGEPFLAVLLTYPETSDCNRMVRLRQVPDNLESGLLAEAETLSSTQPRVGLLGAGNFATVVLLPAMKKAGNTEFIGVCTTTGLSARSVGDKFAFRYCTTDEQAILNDPEINTVVIATRHHLHARQVIAALRAGKHVFCEKPLCLHEQELAEIMREARSSSRVMVGFNRRFAPMARRLKDFLAGVREPLAMHYRVNAGYIPPEHWVHDPEQGGGRIVGEVCHFVDFLTFLAGALPVRVYARALSNAGRYRDDNIVVMVDFADGSLGTITYVANGEKASSKERVEVFGGGTAAVLDDFRRLDLFRNSRRHVSKSRLRQDKGHQGEWEAFGRTLNRGEAAPISFAEIVATTLTTFQIVESLRSGRPEIVKVETLS